MSVEKASKADASPPVSARPGRFPWFALVMVIVCAIWLALQGYATFPLVVIGLTSLSLLFYIYGVMPDRVRRTYWTSPDPIIREIDPGELGGFSAQDDRTRKTAEALGRLGFVERGYYSIEKAHPTGDAHVAIFEDRAGRTFARRIESIVPGKVIAPILAFSTKFADGSEVITSNNATPALTPIAPFRKAFSFSGIEDEARLLALHRRAIAELGEFSTRIDLIGADPIEYLKRVGIEESANQVEAGYLRFDPTANRHRLTRKGAYLMTWKQLWPWGPIRRANRRRLAARRLRAWEGTLI